jgi:branched-chain amino acid transport system substrate-binding protein
MMLKSKSLFSVLTAISFALMSFSWIPVAAASCNSALRIAYQGPLTGPEAALGEYELSGVKFALRKSGLTNVQILEVDDQGDPAVAVKLAPGVAANECVIGLVGPAYSGASRVSLPLYYTSRLPIITPSATNPTLFEYGRDIFHRAVLLDDFQGPAVAQLINAQVPNPRVYVIGDSSDYSNGLKKSVEFSLGSKVVGKEDITYDSKNYSEVIDRVLSSGANTLYFSGYFSQGAQILRNLRLQNSSVKFVGSDGSVVPEFIQLVGSKNAEGALFTSPAIPFEIADPELAIEFRRVMRMEPGVYAAESYDAAMFFFEGIQRGNTSRIQLLNYINTGSFKGITKTLKFDARGELLGTDVHTLVVKGGEFIRVSDLSIVQDPVKPTQQTASPKPTAEEKAPIVISGSASGGTSPTRPTDVPAATSVSSSKVSVKAKTIQCVKGKSIKKVTGVSPKCPKGYKLKS